MLILGILAAIAIPAFLNQKGKANDSSAKTQARTMETAMETFNTDHNTYVGATCLDLNAIDKTIPNPCTTPPSGLTATGYTVTSNAATGTGNVFRVIRNANGSVQRTCTLGAAANAGGCTLAVGATPAAGANGTW
jgi:type IV pilus assembly protein PilA